MLRGGPSIDGKRGLVLASIALACSCDDVGRFSTRPREAYCGAITLGSAFRTGLSPRVQMRLTLDADALDSGEAPGRLWTFEAATEDKPERRMLDGAELRPIPPLSHDPLSHFEMGEGRERNTLFAVSPIDPAEESRLAFLSLRSDGGVEVRLLRAGSAEPDAGDARRTIFGMFSLVRREGQCGF